MRQASQEATRITSVFHHHSLQPRIAAGEFRYRKGAPLPLYSAVALAEACQNTGRRNAPCALLHIGAFPQPCRSDNEKPASISAERRVCVNAKSTDAVGGGARRFAAVSSQPMAPTRPPGDGVSRREIVYQNLTRGARHPAPTLARFEPATSPDRRALPRFRRVSRQSRSCGAAPAANNRGFRQNLPKTLFRQFSLCKHVANMFSNNRFVTSEQHGHLVNGQPNGLTIRFDLHLHLLSRFVNANLLIHFRFLPC